MTLQEPCPFCLDPHANNEIDESHDYRSSPSALQDSAQNGCRYCACLVQAMQLWSPKIPPKLIIRRRKTNTSTYMWWLETVNDDSYPPRDIEVYTQHVNPKYLQGTSGALAPHNDVPPSPNSSGTWKFISTQLAECLESHERCKEIAHRQRAMPKRFLQVFNSGTSVRVVDSATTAELSYAALSYSWGKPGSARTFLTIRSNLEDVRKGVQVSDLPQTLQDAVEVACRLDINLIWIDQLCIIQDDPDDWAEEASKMADVYEGALVTIIAASCTSCGDSFLRQTRKPALDCGGTVRLGNEELRIKARRSFFGGHHRSDTWSYTTLPPDPIEMRAWTLQERLLSTRCIRYTTEEVQWGCQSARLCECSKLTDDDTNYFLDPVPRWKNAPMYTGYWSAVQEYSKRSLTKQGDKLPAFSGLARRLPNAAQSEYLAGMWRETVVRDICWLKESGTHGRRPSRCRDAFPDEYVAPSFSWASTTGHVTLPEVVYPTKHIEVASAEVTLASRDPFGQVRSGFLELRGFLLPVSMSSDEVSCSMRLLWVPEPMSFPVKEDGVLAVTEHPVHGPIATRTRGAVDYSRAIFHDVQAYFVPVHRETDDETTIEIEGIVLGRLAAADGFERLGYAEIVLLDMNEDDFPILKAENWTSYEANFRIY
ncbi:heterokaryon incompatibility protein-domain-containing protein [Biscogniauxia marginata]|nr:heterokaryon incompatibility protein-domain-containing protein [Biscogniauxia marginata]